MKRLLRAVLRRIQANPARFRALVLALLVLLAVYVPGLPVDQIDAVVAAAVVLGAGETSHQARKRRETPTDSI